MSSDWEVPLACASCCACPRGVCPVGCLVCLGSGTPCMRGLLATKAPPHSGVLCRDNFCGACCLYTLCAHFGICFRCFDHKSVAAALGLPEEDCSTYLGACLCGHCMDAQEYYTLSARARRAERGEAFMGPPAQLMSRAGPKKKCVL